MIIAKKFQKAIVVVLLSAVTIFSFWHVVQYNFVNFDDPGFVTNNDHVKSGISLETIKWSFESTDKANWHPLTWISHALDCTLFGLDAGYHHATNLLLHLLSSVLLFLILNRMTKALWQSAFIALVFAVHPLHVESVAWITERKDVLSGLFWMLTIGAYTEYRFTLKTKWYWFAVAAFALGLLAKPMLITLPFVLVLLDIWPFARLTVPASVPPNKANKNQVKLLGSLREKIPFFVLAGASSVVTYLVQRQAGATNQLTGVVFSDRIANAVVSYAEYIWKTIVPNALAVFYPYPGGFPLWEVCGSAFVLVFMTMVVWRQRVRQPYLLVGWLWFLGTLVPVIGIVQTGLQAMADRFMYLPMIGLLIMIAWGVPAFVHHRKISNDILRGAFVLIVLLLIFGTRAQVSSWENNRTLFEHALAVTSDNFLAHNNLGADLADSGKHTEAIPHFHEALRIKPDYIPARHNLGRSLLALGEFHEAIDNYEWMFTNGWNDPKLLALVGRLLNGEGRVKEAINHFVEAIRLDPQDFDSRCRLAVLYSQQGRFEEAKNQCMIILKLEPRNSDAHDVMGIIAARQHQNDEAIKEFLEAIRCDSTNATAYNDLGIFYDRLANTAAAMEMYRSAVRVNARYDNAQFNLGNALAKEGQFGEAEIHWLETISLNPAFVDARVNLGKLYTMQMKFDSASFQLREALRMDSTNVQAHFNYGNLLAKEGKFSEAERQFTETVRLAPDFEAARIALQQIPSK